MSMTSSPTEVRVAIGARLQPPPTANASSAGPATVGRLDLPGKLLQASLWPDVKAVAAGETLAAPLVVELDPTSFCDMRCPECISIELLNEARFPRERLLSLAKEFAELGVRAVILIGGGEPLMHNSVGDVIDILGRAGIAVGLTTNGTMIHRYLEPIAEFVSWTRVSVDAGTAATFEGFRPHLVESNFGDTAAAALARDIGCDYFEVKPTYDLAHFLVAQPPALGELLADAELRTLVTATGAYICPYHRGNQQARYGDPLTESFAEMWSGRRRQETKTAIDPATECRFHCIRHQSNLLLLRMAHEDLSSEFVPDHDPFL